jgi:hypothetical protein
LLPWFLKGHRQEIKGSISFRIATFNLADVLLAFISNDIREHFKEDQRFLEDNLLVFLQYEEVGNFQENDVVGCYKKD